MLKKTIDYTDFNDNRATETLYFNLTKTELSDNLYLKDELEDIQNTLGGESRDLTPAEVQMILDMVKKLMKLSYGIRSEDGKRFIKGEQVWTEFTQTAAYDAFLFSLFENPENAIAFMLGIIPSDLRNQVIASSEGESLTTSTVELPTAEPVVEKHISDEELLKMDPVKMTQEQLLRAFQLKQSQK